MEVGSFSSVENALWVCSLMEAMVVDTLLAAAGKSLSLLLIAICKGVAGRQSPVSSPLHSRWFLPSPPRTGAEIVTADLKQGKFCGKRMMRMMRMFLDLRMAMKWMMRMLVGVTSHFRPKMYIIHLHSEGMSGQEIIDLVDRLHTSTNARLANMDVMMTQMSEWMRANPVIPCHPISS